MGGARSQLSALTTVMLLCAWIGPGVADAQRAAGAAPIAEPPRLPSFTESALEDIAEDTASTPAASAPRWHVLWSANFRLLHLDRQQAQAVLSSAERIRERELQRWTGEEFPLPWSSRADLYLFPSFGEMIAMTGGDPKAGSALVRPSQLYRGRILSRRINLTTDDHELLSDTLPHELTHLILGDLLGGEVPLWANEGAASVAESAPKQRHYAALLRRFFDAGRALRLRDLMALRTYPDGPQKGLFYAQSNSLVHLLLARGGHAKFLEFLRRAQNAGFDRALRLVYTIGGYRDLEQIWRAHVRGTR